MLFNSVAFLLFFPAVCLLYFAIPAEKVRARNVLLLAASYYFYMNWEPAYALLLLTSTIVTWGAALGMSWHTGGGKRDSRKWWLTGSIVANLSILLLFKYYNFLAESLADAMQAAGVAVSMPRFRLLLPVGISFYTFQALGYTMDVYRGSIRAERDILTYALFVSFFPQLVAGPIERSGNLLPQFRERHRFSYAQAMKGIRLMVWGFFLKLVLADRCGIYVDTIFNNLDRHNGGSYLLASLLFTFQIYGDFAGYSLIAIGVARLMGFRLMDNFRSPYRSCAVGEFWHRWHISLSTWFRDYVYIPMGGSRCSRPRQYRNIMVTFALSGLWHGANWTFLCWGCLHGMVLCTEKALGVGRKRHTGTGRMLHWGATFALVCMAWVLFRADSLHEAIAVYTGVFNRPGMPYHDLSTFLGIALAMALLAAKELRTGTVICPRSGKTAGWMLRHLSVAAITACIILFGVLDSNQFIYFQF